MGVRSDSEGRSDGGRGEFQGGKSYIQGPVAWRGVAETRGEGGMAQVVKRKRWTGRINERVKGEREGESN